MKRLLTLVLVASCARPEARAVEIPRIVLPRAAPVAEDPADLEKSAREKVERDDLLGALDDAKRALELRLREGKSAPAALGGAYLLVARVNRDLGRYAEVASAAGRAREIFERELGPESIETGRALELLASEILHERRYEEARPLITRALDIFERAASEEDRCSGLESLGLIEYGIGNYPRAITLYLDALRIGERLWGSSSQKIAGIVGGLGNCYRFNGDIANAKLYLERTVELREGHASPFLSSALNNVATLYHYNLRDFARAEPLYRRALAIAERAYGNDDVGTAQEQMNLGALLIEMGRAQSSSKLTEEGEGYYQRGLDVFERRLGTTHPEYQRAIWYRNTVRQSQP